MNLLRVALKAVQSDARGHVPQEDRERVPAGERKPAVGRKGHTADADVVFEDPCLLHPPQVPEPHRPVITARQATMAIGGEGNTLNKRCMLEPAQLKAGLHIPQSHAVVRIWRINAVLDRSAAAGKNPAALGRKSNAVDVVFVSLKTAELFAGIEVPQDQDAISAAGDGMFVIG